MQEHPRAHTFRVSEAAFCFSWLPVAGTRAGVRRRKAKAARERLANYKRWRVGLGAARTPLRLRTFVAAVRLGLVLGPAHRRLLRVACTAAHGSTASALTCASQRTAHTTSLHRAAPPPMALTPTLARKPCAPGDVRQRFRVRQRQATRKSRSRSPRSAVQRPCCRRVRAACAGTLKGAAALHHAAGVPRSTRLSKGKAGCAALVRAHGAAEDACG